MGFRRFAGGGFTTGLLGGILLAFVPSPAARGEEGAAPPRAADDDARPDSEGGGGAPPAPPSDGVPSLPEKEKAEIQRAIEEALNLIGTDRDAEGRKVYAELRARLEAHPDFLAFIGRKFMDASPRSVLEVFLLQDPQGLLSFGNRDAVDEILLTKIRRDREKGFEMLYVLTGKRGGKRVIEGLVDELKRDPERDYASDLCLALGQTRSLEAVRALFRYVEDHALGDEALSALGPLMTLAGQKEVALQETDYDTFLALIPRLPPMPRELAWRVYLVRISEEPLRPPDPVMARFVPSLVKEAGRGDPGCFRTASLVMGRYPEEYWEELSACLAPLMDPKGGAPVQVQVDCADALRRRKFPAEVFPLLLPLYEAPGSKTLEFTLYKTLKIVTKEKDLGNDPAVWRAWWESHRDAEANRWRARILENTERKKSPPGEDPAARPSK